MRGSWEKGVEIQKPLMGVSAVVVACEWWSSASVGVFCGAVQWRDATAASVPRAARATLGRGCRTHSARSVGRGFSCLRPARLNRERPQTMSSAPARGCRTLSRLHTGGPAKGRRTADAPLVRYRTDTTAARGYLALAHLPVLPVAKESSCLHAQQRWSCACPCWRCCWAVASAMNHRPRSSSPLGLRANRGRPGPLAPRERPARQVAPPSSS